MSQSSPLNKFNDTCDMCDRLFKDNVRIGVRTGVICITCFEEPPKLNLTWYDKGLLRAIGVKVD